MLQSYDMRSQSNTALCECVIIHITSHLWVHKDPQTFLYQTPYEHVILFLLNAFMEYWQMVKNIIE